MTSEESIMYANIEKLLYLFGTMCSYNEMLKGEIRPEDIEAIVGFTGIPAGLLEKEFGIKISENTDGGRNIKPVIKYPAKISEDTEIKYNGFGGPENDFIYELRHYCNLLLKSKKSKHNGQIHPRNIALIIKSQHISPEFLAELGIVANIGPKSSAERNREYWIRLRMKKDIGLIGNGPTDNEDYTEFTKSVRLFEQKEDVKGILTRENRYVRAIEAATLKPIYIGRWGYLEDTNPLRLGFLSKNIYNILKKCGESKRLYTVTEKGRKFISALALDWKPPIEEGKNVYETVEQYLN